MCQAVNPSSSTDSLHDQEEKQNKIKPQIIYNYTNLTDSVAITARSMHMCIQFSATFQRHFNIIY